MSDQPIEGTVEQPKALVVQRERMVTHSQYAAWDSAAFEQLQRVAVVLARSGLVPETLCKEKDERLPEAVVIARCTLICNQANLWNADPLNVLQCTSLINGRLMYEGKLIAAVVASMTGVKLRYKFGLWDKDHITFPEDESGLYGAGELLAVRVYDPDDESRYVDGSVGLWKTARSGSPWSNANNWPRQLRYRGSREWARAYEPGVILGILADGDQDIDEVVLQAKPVGLMERLKGEQEGAGFNNDTVQEQVQPRKRRKKADDPAPEAEPEEAMHAQANSEIRQPEPETSTDTGNVNETPETEQVAGDVSAEAAPSEHAEPGEVYLLAGDGYNNDKRRLTYRNGLRFSSTHKDSEHKYREYAVHAPEVAEPNMDDIPEHMRDGPLTVEEAQAEFMADDADAEGLEGLSAAQADLDAEERPTETGSAPDAEPEPATSETATPASDDGAPQVEDSGPSQQPAADVPQPLADYGEAIERCGSWQDAMDVLKGFLNSDFFKGLSPEQQNRLRGKTWTNLVSLRQFALPDHADNLSAFRLWIEAQTDPEAIQGTLDVLKRSDAWARSPNSHDTIGRAVAVRLAALEG